MTSALSTSTRSIAEQDALPTSMVERVTLIMEQFDYQYRRLSLEEVIHRTGLPRSTTHRILDQLVRLCWLQHTTRSYRLGTRALGLGGRGAGHSALRTAAAPHLHELAVRTGMVVHLAVLDGNEVSYLDKVGGRAAVNVPSRVGGRAPAHRTALGKAMLAWLPPEDVDARYSGTPVDLGALHRELGQIRHRNGLAFERGERFPDIGCVGIALRGPDGPAGALSVVANPGPALERVAPFAVTAARAVTEELIGAPHSHPPQYGTSTPRGAWSSESLARLAGVAYGGWL